MLGLYDDDYQGFTVKHFHENLVKRYGYKLGYTVTRLAGQAPLDLVISLDDATGTLYSAELVAEEGTASSFRGLAETIACYGLFCALYTDRAGHYFHTPKAGAEAKPGLF